VHWSRPAGMAVLRALRRHGWSATTAEIHEHTGSLAVHSDVASARCLLENMGVEDPNRALTCTLSHTTPSRRRVHRYAIAAGYERVVRDILDGRKVQAQLF